MFCRICRQHKQGVVRGSQTRVFIESPCQSYRKDKLDVHMASEHHKIACQRQSGLTSDYNCLNNRQTELCSLIMMIHFISGNTVLASFEPTVVLEHEAVVGAFKCLYWLIKHEIAHHTNYPALLELANLLGCTYFDKLHIGQKTNYRSHRIIDEMLEILATVVEQPILRAIAQSKAIGLEIDETTDVSVCRQMDIHVR
ncbi:hypothetical protein F7725_021420 [Dissostichus mawsoni]|uniref:Uncharacterized protein n=1 Tax=Dissostichus mawsoni TaxID=36200 RepID=A0A7J5ZD09_DISMA|nr:hypothetical protein F7725_021420 [Dissostichus mawsoni]